MLLEYAIVLILLAYGCWQAYAIADTPLTDGRAVIYHLIKGCGAFAGFFFIAANV
jgi:hypothetical protein